MAAATKKKYSNEAHKILGIFSSFSYRSESLSAQLRKWAFRLISLVQFHIRNDHSRTFIPTPGQRRQPRMSLSFGFKVYFCIKVHSLLCGFVEPPAAAARANWKIDKRVVNARNGFSLRLSTRSPFLPHPPVCVRWASVRHLHATLFSHQFA